MRVVELFPRIAIVTLVVLAGAATPSSAHCDSLDGPVVAAARRALDAGEANLVLLWVREADEAEIRAAFEQTLRVRRLSPDARDLADRAFFETLVRVHRKGEGASYDGLKPEGSFDDTAAVLADRAVSAGSGEELAAELARELKLSVLLSFSRQKAASEFATDDLAAGRAWVAAYVSFVHHVDALVGAIERSSLGHPAAEVDHEALANPHAH